VSRDRFAMLNQRYALPDDEEDNLVEVPGLGRVRIDAPGASSASAPGLAPEAVPSGPARDALDRAEARRAQARSERRVAAEQEQAREMVPNAADRRAATERVRIPGLGTEYNPLALMTSVPGASYGMAAIGEGMETLGLERPQLFRNRRERMSNMLDLAELNDPGTAAVGRFAGMIASAPLLEIGGAGAAIGRATTAGEVLGAVGRAARIPVATGAGLGAEAGYLESEGEEDRLTPTLTGAGRGIETGFAVSSLGSLGAGLRSAGAIAPGLRGVAGTVAGGGIEGMGYGTLGRAMETDRRVTDPEYAREVLTPTPLDAGLGAGMALVGRGMASRLSAPDRAPRAYVDPGEAETAAVFGLDPDDVQAVDDLAPYTRPEREGNAISEAIRPMSDYATEARLSAGGVATVRQRRQAERAFGTLDEAANAIRESGISPRGSARSVFGNVRHAEVVRNRASARLNALYNLSESRGGQVPGNVIADELDSIANTMADPSALPETVNAVEGLRAMADDYRYGRMGRRGPSTPERAAYETERQRIEEMPYLDDAALQEAPEAPPGLEGLTFPEREATGLRLDEAARRSVAPRLIPTREVVRGTQQLRNIARDIREAPVGSPALRASLQRRLYTALTNGREVALRQSIPERMPEYEQASRDFRIANVVAPYDASAGQNTAAAANLGADVHGAANGPLAWLARHTIEPYRHGIRASIAERSAAGGVDTIRDAAALGVNQARQLRVPDEIIDVLDRTVRGGAGAPSFAEQRAALEMLERNLPPGADRNVIAAAHRRAAAADLLERGGGAIPAAMAGGAAPNTIADREARREFDEAMAAEDEIERRSAEMTRQQRRRELGLEAPPTVAGPESEDDIIDRQAAEMTRRQRRRELGLEPAEGTPR
jgi:hypothetical protein